MRIAILTLAVAVAVLGAAPAQEPLQLWPGGSPRITDDSTQSTILLGQRAGPGFYRVSRPEPRRPLEAPPTTAEVREERVQRLERSADRTVRLAAIRWLKEHSYVSDAALAVPALERCARVEEGRGGQGRGDDPELRGEAVSALALIAYALRRPCPLPVVEALLDKDEDVRWQAIHHIGIFKSFPRGSVELLLRSAESEQPQVRDASVGALVGAGGKEKRALAAIEKAKSDREFLVRHNAHVAAFQVTGNLEPYLRYRIRLAEGDEAVLRPVPQDPKLRERDESVRNMFVLDHLSGRNEWSEDLADELAPALLRLLDDKAPLVRRGAARQIGAAAIKSEGLGWIELLLPYVEEDLGTDSPQKPKKPTKPQPTKHAFALEKLKAPDRLRRLIENDPDETVRGAAATALDRLDGVLGKKP